METSAAAGKDALRYRPFELQLQAEWPSQTPKPSLENSICALLDSKTAIVVSSENTSQDYTDYFLEAKLLELSSNKINVYPLETWGALMNPRMIPDFCVALRKDYLYVFGATYDRIDDKTDKDEVFARQINQILRINISHLRVRSEDSTSSLSSVEWEIVSTISKDVPTPRTKSSIAFKNDDEFLIFGGTSDQDDPLDDLWQFSLVDRTWKRIVFDSAGTIAPNRNAMMKFDGDKLLMCGGSDRSVAMCRWTQRDSPFTNVVESVGLPPEPREGGCLHILDHQNVLLIGGGRSVKEKDGKYVDRSNADMENSFARASKKLVGVADPVWLFNKSINMWLPLQVLNKSPNLHNLMIIASWSHPEDPLNFSAVARNDEQIYWLSLATANISHDSDFVKLSCKSYNIDPKLGFNHPVFHDCKLQIEGRNRSYFVQQSTVNDISPLLTVLASGRGNSVHQDAHGLPVITAHPEDPERMSIILDIYFGAISQDEIVANHKGNILALIDEAERLEVDAVSSLLYSWLIDHLSSEAPSDAAQLEKDCWANFFVDPEPLSKANKILSMLIEKEKFAMALKYIERMLLVLKVPFEELDYPILSQVLKALQNRCSSEQSHKFFSKCLNTLLEHASMQQDLSAAEDILATLGVLLEQGLVSEDINTIILWKLLTKLLETKTSGEKVDILVAFVAQTKRRSSDTEIIEIASSCNSTHSFLAAMIIFNRREARAMAEKAHPQISESNLIEAFELFTLWLNHLSPNISYFRPLATRVATICSFIDIALSSGRLRSPTLANQIFKFGEIWIRDNVAWIADVLESLSVDVQQYFEENHFGAFHALLSREIQHDNFKGRAKKLIEYFTSPPNPRMQRLGWFARRVVSPFPMENVEEYFGDMLLSRQKQLSGDLDLTELALWCSNLEGRVRAPEALRLHYIACGLILADRADLPEYFSLVKEGLLMDEVIDSCWTDAHTNAMKIYNWAVNQGLKCPKFPKSYWLCCKNAQKWSGEQAADEFLTSTLSVVLPTPESVNALYPWGLTAADKKSEDDCEATLLFQFAHKGCLPMVKALLRFGASHAVATSANPATPLWAACAKGHNEIALLLLKHGADPFALGKPIRQGGKSIKDDSQDHLTTCFDIAREKQNWGLADQMEAFVGVQPNPPVGTTAEGDPERP